MAPRFEMREVQNGTGGSSLVFSGYASIVEAPYEMQDMFGSFNETIARNAFATTLGNGADVAFVLNHGANGGAPMARTKPGTLKLAADQTGLHTEARLNPTRSDVQIVRAAVEDGDLDEMSFAFRCVEDDWDEEYTERRILEVNMHQGDVSIVNYGANPATAGTVSLAERSAKAHAMGLTVESVIALFEEFRSGSALSSANTATLTHVLSLITTADNSVDEALVRLSGVLGVPNPDKDAPPPAPDPAVLNTKSIYIPDHTKAARDRLRLLTAKGA
jgi:HK97 family phage prohead protease